MADPEPDTYDDDTTTTITTPHKGAVGEQYSSTFVYLITFGASLGAMCFGYNVAIVSGLLLFAQPDLQLDTTWQTVVAGGAVVTATVSALMAGGVTDHLGRRLTLLLTAALCVAGPLLAAAAPGKEVLLAGRAVTGLTFPLTLAFCPLYIAEMSPVSIRGRLTILNQLQLATGRLLAAIMAGAFSYLPSHHWRYMQGFAALLGLMFAIAVFLLPDTPRWLVAKGRCSEAAIVLQRIYGYHDPSRIADIEDSIAASSHATGACSTLSQVLKTPHMLKALAVGSCLAFFFVWTGINILMFYSGTIMKSVGFPVEHAVWVQGVAPLAMFISVFPGILAVERCGRRPIVLVSLGGSALSHVLSSVGFHVAAADLPPVHYYNGTTNSSLHHQDSLCYTYSDCEACVQDSNCGLCYNEERSGLCLPALNQHYSALGPCAMDNQRDDVFAAFAFDFCPTPYAWIVVAGIFSYCLFFSAGMAGVTFTILAEIFPTWARSTCTSIVMTQFWLGMIVISFSFLYMVDVLKLYGTFWLFAGMTTLGFVLLYIFLPETKNRTLEEVEELFMTSQQLQRHHEQRERRQSVRAEKEHDQIKPLINQETTQV